MEDESKISHSPPATYTLSEPTNSDFGDDPHAATADGGDEAEEVKDDPEEPEDQETVRESKRRKILPSVLDQCESIFINSCCSSTSDCLSFSFDPKFSSGVSTPEVTPKFGSFNLAAAAAVTDDGISTEIEEKDVEEKEDEVEEKRNCILEVLGSVDALTAD